MPIYEYQCRACSQQLEVIQKFSDAPLTECPACGKSALQKMISAPAFQLKGSGWYQTDFKDMGRKKPSAGSADTKGAAPDKPATEGAGETKAAPGANATPKPAASGAD